MIVCVAMAVSWFSGVNRSRVLMLRIQVAAVGFGAGSHIKVGVDSRVGGKVSVGWWEPRHVPISRVVSIGAS